jgi:lipoprotein-anchoring transpeptidase ErfK/SrfK
VIDHHHALRFPVGVGRAGEEWTGEAHIEGKYVRPAWSPPPEIRRDYPNLPRHSWRCRQQPDGRAAALTMRGGEYAIHGTNNPASTSGAVAAETSASTRPPYLS